MCRLARKKSGAGGREHADGKVSQANHSTHAKKRESSYSTWEGGGISKPIVEKPSHNERKSASEEKKKKADEKRPK